MYFTERDDNGSNVPRNNIPFLIGVSGGTGSGKSTLCQRIMAKLAQEDEKLLNRGVVCISQDSFYRDLTSAEKLQAGKGEFNFDHPDAFNKELMKHTLLEILSGKVVKIPKYDYKSHTLLKNEMITINPSDVVIFEGILIFHFPEIRELFHMKLFVDTLSDTRLTRRVQKDVNERGRKLEEVLNQYLSFVKPAFDDFCFPSKKFANVVIPGGGDNLVVINLIVRYILHIIKEPGEKNFDDINYDKICENKSGKKCEERYR